MNEPEKTGGPVKDAIDCGDVALLRQLLDADASLANQEILWRTSPEKKCSEDAPPNASVPLHYVCDAIFCGHITAPIGMSLCNELLERGADMETISSTGQDTPLIAAASLYCEQIGIRLVDHGADVSFSGTFGGTPLHWAAWTGQLQLVKRLLDEPQDLEKRCDQFYCTPLFWAAHGRAQGGPSNQHQQLDVAKLLVERGADINMGNRWDKTMRQMFDLDHRENEFFRWLETIGAPETID